MNESHIYEPGEKTHRDENFPVASYLIGKPYRAAVLAFYRFARTADDVADHPDLSEKEKIDQLDGFEATLLGQSDATADAIPLREEIARSNLSPRHAQDLLVAFRQDARKSRYADWGELINYCSHSAAPVGRFVLDVHGESQSVWPASDALCSVLQIINHLQDCKVDYQRLDRVYIPADALAQYSISETELGAAKATPALRACLVELVGKTQLLMGSSIFSHQVRNMRLALEVAVIERLAQRLLNVLLARDPLSERVHLGKSELICVTMKAVLATLAKRAFTGRNGQLSPGTP